MKNREEIIEILKNNLSYVYCDSCEFNLESECCDYCHRKSMNWGISTAFAEAIADAILS